MAANEKIASLRHGPGPGAGVTKDKKQGPQRYTPTRPVIPAQAGIQWLRGSRSVGEYDADPAPKGYAGQARA